MTPADYYSVTFALMAEAEGGVDALEIGLRKHEQEREKLAYNNSPDRMAPDRKVPEVVAMKMREAMEFTAPAPLKGQPDQ